MNITIQVDSAKDLKLLEEYCLKELGKNFRDAIQQRVDTFVNNALGHMRQRRQIKEDMENFAEAFKETVNAR